MFQFLPWGAPEPNGVHLNLMFAYAAKHPICQRHQVAS